MFCFIYFLLDILKTQRIPSTSYSYDKKTYDLNKDRVESQKLKVEHRKETKGAIRELRKDGQFIARQRLQERQDKAVEHKKKMDVIMGNLANQEGAMRGYEKEAGKKRKKF